MMAGGTKRTPIRREARSQITPRAVELFRAMQRAPDGSRKWDDLEGQLHAELKLRVWQWPPVSDPQAPCSYATGATGMNAGAQWYLESVKLWQALEAEGLNNKQYEKLTP